MKKNKPKGKSQVAPLTLAGDLTIGEVATIAKSFSERLKGRDDVVLQFDQVGEVDLSFLQLLYATQQAVQKNNRKMTLLGDFPDAVQDEIKRAGLEASSLALLAGPAGPQDGKARGEDE